MESEIKTMVSKAVEKSLEALDAAEVNLASKHYETCENRLYYAIFYIVSALAYKDNFITSKHSQLMGWFNRKYIYENHIFDSKMFAIYKEAFENRQKSDYDFVYTPDKDELILMLEDVKLFVSTVKKYLGNLSA